MSCRCAGHAGDQHQRGHRVLLDDPHLATTHGLYWLALLVSPYLFSPYLSNAASLCFMRAFVVSRIIIQFYIIRHF